VSLSKQMNGRCERVGDHLPAFLDDPAVITSSDQRHLDGCLRCQADLVRLRRIGRVLGSMHTQPVPSDLEVLGAILDGLDSAAERRVRHRAAGLRAASIVGLAAATAAGVGGVLVIATRRRSA